MFERSNPLLEDSAMARLLLLSVTLLGSACGGLLVGNGTRVTERREVPAFSALEVHDGLEVVATKGERALSLTTDENVMPFIETFVRGDRLVVQVRGDTGLLRTTSVRVDVSNDRYEGVLASGAANVSAPITASGTVPVEASGASTVVLTGLEVSQVTLDASGASTVKLDGRTTALSMNVSGASTVRARPLTAGTVTLSVEGASTVDVTSAISVTGHASGASTVELAGPGTSSVTSSGASTVRRLD